MGKTIKSKAQEALDIVARYCSDSKHGIHRLELSNELDIVQEALDKQNPIKPTYVCNGYNHTGFFRCSCGYVQRHHFKDMGVRFCRRCGQALLFGGERDNANTGTRSDK